jgi:hypothetical protein
MPLIRSAEPGQDGNPRDAQVPYEAPVLTPIGCLHDLLAGGGTQNCDGTTFIGVTGGQTPETLPVPPFCT